MRHGLGFSQAGRIGYGCTASDVHEYALSGERTFAAVTQCDLHGARGDKYAVAEDEFITSGVIFVQMNLDDPLDHLALALVDPRHVDHNRPRRDSELAMP